MSQLIVQKYGGSSLAKPEHIQEVAERIARLHRDGHRLIIVVSAMGKTTDQLVDLAYQVSSCPNRRELDMLLTTGERISMALMSMALNDRGCSAISFTGSQAGVFTDESHSNARIVDVQPPRVEAELARGHIVVLAGFQGVSPRTKEVTTLGRGGSDTTAVAMAAKFQAERCEIRKDVDGVYSGDPNQLPGARHLPRLHYRALLDMTFWGAKVLHYRSVELATLMEIPLLIALAHDNEDDTARSTLIDGDTKMYEKAHILSVNGHKDVRRLKVRKADLAEAFQEISRALKKADLPLPQFLDAETTDGDGAKSCSFLITAPAETLTAIAKTSAENAWLELENGRMATVTATCQGAFASPLPEEIARQITRQSIALHKMIFGAMSVTVVVDAEKGPAALKAVHELMPG